MEACFRPTARYRTLFNSNLASYLEPLTAETCPEIELCGSLPNLLRQCRNGSSNNNDDDDDDTTTKNNSAIRCQRGAFDAFHAAIGSSIAWMSETVLLVSMEHAADDSWRSILHPNVMEIRIASCGIYVVQLLEERTVTLNHHRRHGSVSTGSATDTSTTNNTTAPVTACCDFLVALVAADQKKKTATTRTGRVVVRLPSYWPVPSPAPVSAAALGQLCGGGAAAAHELHLKNFCWSRAHCQALTSAAAATVDDNETNDTKTTATAAPAAAPVLYLDHCGVMPADAAAFVALCHDPSLAASSIHLQACWIPNHVLALCLTAGSRVESVRQFRYSYCGPGIGRLLRVLGKCATTADTATAANGNKPLLREFHWHPHQRLSAAQWDALCRAVSVHPTLTTLGFAAAAAASGGIASTSSTSSTTTTPTTMTTTSATNSSLLAAQTARTLALAAAIQHNTVLHTIAAPASFWNTDLFVRSIQPQLDVNRYRPQLAALQQSSQRLVLLPAALSKLAAAIGTASSPTVLHSWLQANADALVRTRSLPPSTVVAVVASVLPTTPRPPHRSSTATAAAMIRPPTTKPNATTVTRTNTSDSLRSLLRAGQRVRRLANAATVRN